MNASTTTLLAAGAAALLAAPALAFPVGTDFIDAPHCDPLAGPKESLELGTSALFPVDCSIFADSEPNFITACSMSDDPTAPDAIVRMLNTSGQDFEEVWYVADEGTSFSNYDGAVNGFHAFKIDALGGNVPLIAESIAADGVFQDGEFWQFIVQDYTNALGIPAHDFVSVGVPSVGPVSGSSGSIIARPVPTPGVAATLALAGLAAGSRRRRA
jgi:hypothetical protein